MELTHIYERIIDVMRTLQKDELAAALADDPLKDSKVENTTKREQK
jgi:hypothetical protein